MYNQKMFMKKFITIAACVLSAISMQAQNSADYKPTDKWPYIFEKYEPAVIHQTGGRSDIKGDFNITVDGGYIHHIGNGTILLTSVTNMESMDIAGRKYVLVNARAKEVVAETEAGMILRETVYLPGGGTDIGYGINTTTYAANDLDLTAAVMLGNNMIHAKLNQAVEERAFGVTINYEQHLYFYVKKQYIRAERKAFQDAVGKEKAQAYIKANKPKWNDVPSLVKALDFLNENM